MFKKTHLKIEDVPHGHVSFRGVVQDMVAMISMELTRFPRILWVKYTSPMDGSLEWFKSEQTKTLLPNGGGGVCFHCV